MVQMIVEYEDGRRFQTTDEGFAANHEPFGARVVAYVGIDGQRRPATAAGKRGAEEATDPLDTPVIRQTTALQAAAAGESAAGGAGSQDEQQETPAEGGYAARTVVELRAMMDERGIAVPDGAKKADLVAALTAADGTPKRTQEGEP